MASLTKEEIVVFEETPPRGAVREHEVRLVQSFVSGLWLVGNVTDSPWFTSRDEAVSWFKEQPEHPTALQGEETADSKAKKDTKDDSATQPE